MRAINGYVILQPEEKGETTSPSGLIIPETKEIKVSVGTVVSVPEQVFFNSHGYDTPFVEGDRVLYSPSLAIPYGKYLLYPILNVYAVLE